MYIVVLLASLATAVWLVASGTAARGWGRVWLGCALFAVTVTLFGLMSFWGELLWYENLGFASRFWTEVWVRSLLVLAGGTAAYALASVETAAAGPVARKTASRVAALAGVIWGLACWQDVLLFWHGEATTTLDPMLGMSTGFYLFVLPFLDGIFWLLLSIAVIALVSGLALGAGDARTLELFKTEPAHPLAIPIASAFVALTLGYGEILGVFHLLYSELGVVMGPGWTDVHVRFPALVAMGAVFLIAGALPVSGRFRGYMRRLMARRLPLGPPNLMAVISAWVAIGVLWVGSVVVLPALVQWLVVKPNEITFELPYIARNIEFTRKGFRLDKIQEREFSPSAELRREVIAENQNLLSEVRLWDWRALDAVYRQFQEIRLYYEFDDVDLDRYMIGDRYRQVMVSARELSKRNLPSQSQTFVNERFKYTHGYGYTLAPVRDFTKEGLPNLLVQDIPPRTNSPELALERPEIYYGELTDDAVVVNTREAEFDYPQGETNVYTRYAGVGGVQLSNFWRKLLFGWKFDGTVFLLSSYPNAESRIMFHRRVQDRVRELAPFLVFDEDPYIVSRGGSPGAGSWTPIRAPATTRTASRSTRRERIEYRRTGYP